MIGLQALPDEVLGLIIEQLVITIQKAVLLRSVNRAFGSAILHAFSGSTRRWTASLLGDDDDEERRESRHKSIAGEVLPVDLVDPEDEENGDVGDNSNDSIIDNAQAEAQNLLSGAVIMGNLSLLKLLLIQSNGHLSSSSMGVNVTLRGCSSWLWGCGSPAAVHRHINAYADKPRSFYGTLIIAASMGNIDMDHLLLERSASVHTHGPRTPGNPPIEAGVDHSEGSGLNGKPYGGVVKFGRGSRGGRGGRGGPRGGQFGSLPSRGL
ncbi:hypothetical protein PG994_001104 [Apiospora phragmitis]|uniref:F-box domain-containing protein n=1 Tax=Apiospora phragmitis TaxID=2905665 RepID=A0ABR1WSL5_9PEZI